MERKDTRVDMMTIGIVIGAIIAGAASWLWFGYKQDNPIEELSEEVIEYHTGMAVDLSPQSPEKKGPKYGNKQ